MNKASKTWALMCIAVLCMGCASKSAPVVESKQTPPMPPPAIEQPKLPAPSTGLEEWFAAEMQKQGVAVGDVAIEAGLGASKDKSGVRLSVKVNPSDVSKAAQDVVLATSILAAADTLNGVEVRVFDTDDQYQGSLFVDKATVRKFFVDRSISDKEFEHAILIDLPDDQNDDNDDEPLLLVMFPEANVLDD